MRTCLVSGLAIFSLFTLQTQTRAEIVGFNNLVGWTYNQPDGGTPANLLNANTIELTTGVGQRRSVFFNTPQTISQFSASFTYRDTAYQGPEFEGIAFVLQNSAAGAAAIGGGNGGLGFTGISNSAGTFIYGNPGDARQYNGYSTNETLGSGSTAIAAGSLAGRELGVNILYINPILTVTIDDLSLATPPEFTRNYVVGDLASIVGSSSAYIGITASTGSFLTNSNGSKQSLSNFQFSSQSIPEPTSISLLGVACIAIIRRRPLRSPIQSS